MSWWRRMSWWDRFTFVASVALFVLSAPEWVLWLGIAGLSAWQPSRDDTEYVERDGRWVPLDEVPVDPSDFAPLPVDPEDGP